MKKALDLRSGAFCFAASTAAAQFVILLTAN